MLSKEMNYIKLSGTEYPIRCDMLVLEKIQEEYGDISDFENKLLGFTPSRNKDGTVKKDDKGRQIGISGIPDIKALNLAVYWMVNEGLEVEDRKGELLTKEKAARMIDYTPKELSELLHKEFMRCFQRKNGKTTQNQETTANQNR